MFHLKTFLLCLLVALAMNSCWGAKQVSVSKAKPRVKVPLGTTFGQEPDLDSAKKKASPEQVVEAERRVQRQPDDFKTLNDAGVVIAASGDRERALELLQKSVQLAPQDPTVNYNLARVFYDAGQIDDAQTRLQTALNQQPQFVEAQVLQANIHIGKSDYAAATGMMQNVLKEHPNVAEAQIAAGVALMGQGKVDEAIHNFERAKELASDDAIASYNLGVAYQEKNDLNRAKSYYEEAIAKDPELAEAHNNLGTILAAQGDLAKSFEELHKAFELKPDDPTFTKNLSGVVTGEKESEDKLVGDWEYGEGTMRIWGNVNGQSLSHSMTVPLKAKLKITKAGSGEYEMAEQATTGKATSVTTRVQADGSYQGTIPMSAFGALPPEISRLDGIITFWKRGDVLFGDTRISLNSTKGSAQASVHWKAQRVK